MKDITYFSDNTIVCYTSEVNRQIKKQLKELPDCMSEAEVDRIYSMLYPLVFVDEEDRAKHIEQVNNKKYGRKTKLSNDELPDILKCPYCGGELVVRTAKHGPSAGSKFYGCSNFPNCRYTRNIN